MFERILMPVDGSPCSEQAVTQGLDFARQMGSTVTFLYVVEDPFSYVPNGMVSYTRVYEDMEKAGEELLSQMEEKAKAAGVPARSSLVTGALAHPVDAILEAAEEQDLVLMGTHGRRGFDRWFLGSVTEGVLRRSTKPHLVIKCDRNEPDEEGVDAGVEGERSQVSGVRDGNQ